MKKFLIFSMLFVCGVTSFAFTPKPTTVSSPDWVVIVNDKGTYVYDDGNACITLFYNTSKNGIGSMSNCGD